MAATTEESRLIRQVYAGALQRDPEERGEYLDRARRGDLRARVVALLDAHSEDVLETPTVAVAGAGDYRPGHAPGQMVGPYIIRHEIGRGGMGIVYLADDTRLSRTIALKALNQEFSRDSDGRERLRREARAAAGLSHPGIATVYALEEIDDQLYLASVRARGDATQLGESGPCRSSRWSHRDWLAAVQGAAGGAHAGVVHRDIKPENVISVPSGVVKVLDFGLAHVEGIHPELTQTGVIVGTPAYLAPEQAQGNGADFRTDLFAWVW